MKELKSAGAFAIDVETDSIDARTAKLVGIAVCWEPGVAYYVPVGHQPETLELMPTVPQPKQLDIKDVLKGFKPILENAKIEKYIQHAKFEYLVFLNYDIELDGIAFDTMHQDRRTRLLVVQGVSGTGAQRELKSRNRVLIA